MIGKAIRFIFLVIILISAVSIVIQLKKNQPLSIIKRLDLQNRSSAANKIMVFKLNFLGFLPIGEAEFDDKGEESYQDKKVYHLSAQARASGFISRFFNPQAQIDSYIDKNRLHSLRFRQTLIIPDKPKDEKVVLYDQENHIMELREVRRQILPDTQDPLSAMFYLQRQTIELGDEFDININTNQKNYQLYVKVIKKEEYALEDKKLGIWVLQGDIRRRDKSPRHSSSITLWILDSPTKPPILIKVTTGAVHFIARLSYID